MPFPQDQVARLVTNRARIARVMFIPQLVAALLFLGFAYVTGKVHAHLLITGARTQGKIIALVPVRMQDRTRSGTTMIYEPVIEFGAGDRVLRFQEWKGSQSSAGLGWAVPVVYDPAKSFRRHDGSRLRELASLGSLLCNRPDPRASRSEGHSDAFARARRGRAS
jgi:hypothetical protein